MKVEPAGHKGDTVPYQETNLGPSPVSLTHLDISKPLNVQGLINVGPFGPKPTTELCVDFAHMTDMKDYIKARLADLERAMDNVGEEIKTRFESEGVCSIKTHGRRIYLHSQTWPKMLKDKDAVLKALRKSGNGELVYETYNAQTFAKLIREFPKKHGEIQLPPEFENVIEPSTKYSVRCAKA